VQATSTGLRLSLSIYEASLVAHLQGVALCCANSNPLLTQGLDVVFAHLHPFWGDNAPLFSPEVSLFGEEGGAISSESCANVQISSEVFISSRVAICIPFCKCLQLRNDSSGEGTPLFSFLVRCITSSVWG